MLSFILVFCMMLSCYAAPDKDLASANSEEEKTTNRYYFYMPSIWKNKHSDTAGIYWWDGTDACESWPGYKAHETDVKGVYYYDVPKDVTTIIWNNFLNGGRDNSTEIYWLANQTKSICSEYYDPDESLAHPNGTESFDGMIFVTDFRVYISDYSTKASYEGEWYYYYGNGEYGLTPAKGEVFCKSPYLMEPLEIGEFAIYDVNADGDINIKDATAIQKYCAKLVDFDEGQIKRTNAWVYDWNGNFLGYNVTVKDATHIQKFVANLLYNRGEITKQ